MRGCDGFGENLASERDWLRVEGSGIGEKVRVSLDGLNRLKHMEGLSVSLDGLNRLKHIRYYDRSRTFVVLHLED